MIESPIVAVHLPPMLRALASGRDEVMASGETVGEVLESLGHELPGVLQTVLHDGRVLPAFAVYLGGLPIEGLQGLATPVGLEETVSIIATAAA